MQQPDILQELAREYNLAGAAIEVLSAFAEDGSYAARPFKNQIQGAWVYLRKELFHLLCTDKKTYEPERTIIKTGYKPFIAGLALALARDFGLETQIATAICALAVTVPLKISVRAWCSRYSSSHTLPSVERNVLREIAEPHRDDDPV